MKKEKIIIIIASLLIVLGACYLFYNKILFKSDGSVLQDSSLPNNNDNLETYVFLQNKIEDYYLTSFHYTDTSNHQFNENMTQEQFKNFLIYYEFQINQWYPDEIPKEAVDTYFKEVYNFVPTEYIDFLCHVEDTVLYHYDQDLQVYVKTGYHGHDGEPLRETIYTKINDAFQDNEEFVLRLNAIYYPSILHSSCHLFADENFEHPIEELDLFLDDFNCSISNKDELIRYYDRNYDSFKNTMPIFEYRFVKVNDNYVLKAYHKILKD